MKSVGKSIIFSVLLSVLFIGLLNYERLTTAKKDVRAIEVAAGDIDVSDPTSTEPLVQCYEVDSPDELDIRTRMDFEARTSAGWVADTSQSGPKHYCIIESPQAVEKRLADQAKK